MSELSEFQKEVGGWASEAFGHRDSQKVILSILKHLEKEMLELRLACLSPRTKDIEEELSDCFIILLDLAHIRGCDLLAEAKRKMEINRKRKWGKPDKDGVIEHV